MTHHTISYYMSRRIDIPPFVAQASYDAQGFGAGDRMSAIDAGHRVRLLVRGAASVTGGHGYRPFRTQPATLVVGIRSYRVELELLPWSDTHTELGLRPAGTALWSTPRASILEAGCAVLQSVGDRLTRWADAPLAEAIDALARGSVLHVSGN